MVLKLVGYLMADWEVRVPEQQLEKHTQHICIRAPNLKRTEKKVLQPDHPPWEVLSHFLSLSISLSKHTCPLANFKERFKVQMYFAYCPLESLQQPELLPLAP